MDLILFNSSVLTMDAGSPRAEAVAVKDGLIIAAGSSRDILTLRREGTNVIDAGGKSILPGFNDSHLHLYGYALMKGMADLGGVTSIGGLRDALISHIRAKNPPEGEWVLGRGWDQTPYPEGRMPDRHDLDGVSQGHPVMLTRKCGHVCVLNTAALKASGILERPPIVEGGLVELAPDGTPTGILKENAMNLAAPAAGEMAGEKIQTKIAAAARDFVKAGLTSVQTDDLSAFSGNPAALFEAYLRLAAEGRLPLRVNEQMLLPSPDKLRQVMDMGYKTGFGNDFFRIGPLKLLADGSFGGRSAWLSAPYADDPGNTGIALFSREQLNELVLMAHEGGMQVAAHAIGDAAVAAVLDAFREAQRARPRPGARFRVVHASLTPPELLVRFREQGIAADVQPGFVPADAPFIRQRLGAERASHAYCFRDFLIRGIHLGGGSDCPVEDYRPLSGIHAAVNREGRGGEGRADGEPGQRLTLQEAIYLYTMGSAYNAFEENIKGSITAGKLADLVILSGDIERTDPEGIRELGVDMTIVGGKVVYSR